MTRFRLDRPFNSQSGRCFDVAVGQARHVQSIPGKKKRAPVFHTDGADVYAGELPRVLYHRTSGSRSFTGSSGVTRGVRTSPRRGGS